MNTIKWRFIGLVWKIKQWFIKNTLKMFRDHTLELHLVDRGHAIAMWSYHDVIYQAEQSDPPIPITEQDARDIISELHHQHDCNHGITWEHINNMLWDYERELTKAQSA